MDGGGEMVKATTYVNAHVFVESVIDQQIMSHSNAMRLHGMALSVVIVAHLGYEW